MEPAKKDLAFPAEDWRGWGGNNTHKVGNKQLIVLRPAQEDLEKEKGPRTVNELSTAAAINQRPTSDGQVGRGLHFPHTVLRQAGVGPLIAHRRLLNPQQEVLFVISDVVPADKYSDVLKAVVT